MLGDTGRHDCKVASGPRAADPSDMAIASLLDVEDDQKIVFQNAPEFVPKISIQVRVVCEPPERRPGENYVLRTIGSHPIYFAKCSLVAGGWPPILSVMLWEIAQRPTGD